MMNKRKTLILLLLTLTMVFTLVGCSKEEAKEDLGNVKDEVSEIKDEVVGISVTDDLGNELSLDKEAEKVVSLAPSITETLFALGLDDEIVGVTEYCDYPEAALGKEKVASFSEPNMEKILGQSPDLVIQGGQLTEEHIKTLEDADINVVMYNPHSLEGVYKTIEDLGTLTGKEDEAASLKASLKAKEEEITDKLEAVEKKTVFYEIWHDPLQAAGPGSFMDELINLAGGENIAKDAESAYAQYDVETLIEKNPEIYLGSDDGMKTIDDIKARTGYDNIKAIEDGNVFLLDANVVSRPGPRIMDALELVAKAIHPDLF